MAVCPYCNHELVSGARFCGKCGSKIPAPVEEEAIVPPVEETPEVPHQESVQEETPAVFQEENQPAEPVEVGFHQDAEGLIYYQDETGAIYYEDEEGNPYSPVPEEDAYAQDPGDETFYQNYDEEIPPQEDFPQENPFQTPPDTFDTDNNYRDGYSYQEPVKKEAFSGKTKKAMASVTPFFQNAGAAAAGFFGKVSDSVKNGAASLREKREESAGKPRAPKKGLKKILVFGSIGLAAVIAIVVLSLVLSNGRSRDEYALFLQDGEMYYTDFSKKEPMEITSRLGIEDAAVVSQCTAMSEDHKRLFFPDKMEGNPNDTSSIRFTLYYRDVTKPREEPEKIDSDIRSYVVNKAGDQVVYIKGDNGYLYLHDLEDKEKITDNVTYVSPIADMEDSFIYLTDNTNYFLWTIGQEPVEIHYTPENKEDAKQTFSVMKNLGYSHFYYLDGDSLYMMSDAADAPEKVASDVNQIVSSFKNGGIYYTKASTTEHKYMEFVTDDLMDSDKLVKEPAKPKYPDAPRYPWRYSYETEEEYKDAMGQYYEDYEVYEKTREEMEKAYNEAYELYSQKSDRDYMREALETKTITMTHNALYFFDGATETLLEEEFNEVSRNYYGYYNNVLGAPAITYNVFDRSNLPHFLVSELHASSEVGDAVSQAMNQRILHAAFGSNVVSLEEADEETLSFLDDNQALYYFTDVTSYHEADLYKISYIDGKLSEAERVDTDVVCAKSSFMPRSLYFNADSKDLIYFKDPDEESGSVTLCLNGEEIAEDVYPGRIGWLCGKLTYCTDWNDDKETVSFYVYENGESILLGEDILSTSPASFDQTNICFLEDYSAKRHKGSLYRYNGGEAELVAEDVSGIIYRTGILKGYF